MREPQPPLEIEADFEEVANPGRRAGDRAGAPMKLDLLFAATLIANLFAPPARDGVYPETGVRRGHKVNFRT